jgi:hypothetical protein
MNHPVYITLIILHNTFMWGAIEWWRHILVSFVISDVWFRYKFRQIVLWGRRNNLRNWDCVYYDGMRRCLSCTEIWNPSDRSDQRFVCPKNKTNDRQKATWNSALILCQPVTRQKRDCNINTNINNNKTIMVTWPRTHFFLSLFLPFYIHLSQTTRSESLFQFLNLTDMK